MNNILKIAKQIAVWAIIVNAMFYMTWGTLLATSMAILTSKIVLDETPRRIIASLGYYSPLKLIPYSISFWGTYYLGMSSYAFFSALYAGNIDENIGRLLTTAITHLAITRYVTAESSVNNPLIAVPVACALLPFAGFASFIIGEEKDDTPEFKA